MSYRTISDSEVDRNSPVTETLATAWRDNPIGIAQRDTGAPRVKPATIEVVGSAGSSGTWTVPDGVTRIRATLVGGGGGGASEDLNGDPVDGGDGGDTTLNDGATTYTAGGGSGTDDQGTTVPGTPGSATNGDLNLDGVKQRAVLCAPYYGDGGDGGGQYVDDYGGGAASLVVNVEVSPGDSLSYAVGAGGAAGSGGIAAAGEDGRDGVLVIEY